MPNSCFLIVDGSSLLVRAYFATAYSGQLMQTKSGVCTNGIHGFLHMLTGACEIIRPSHLFIAWDVSRDTFRREIFPQYKATRGELPVELLPQFDLAQQVLKDLGVAQYSHPRFEADDLIGSMARIAERQGHSATILTGDRDSLQLITDLVTVAITKKGIKELEYYTPTRLHEELRIQADQIRDLKALMGDASDNIPGVSGIGEKTALKLLLEHGTIENLFENLHTVKGKLREKLELHRDSAFLSKKLATIVTDIPMELDVADCRMQFLLDQAKDRLLDLELHRVIQQLQRLTEIA
ncbi:5'-3' exonuclease [Effusibacillus lacus]|uniref:5'-3' exonuclease n=1 Tax=Effusibacillus lacus TaxID=1348429 RepID=A0A292YE26_9BACL|nr:5'-3' exonuclease H3TH domain-containing protein [Effusibacillus lacus]TCS68058.1 5'-3' exonuclease [Effusibacillus lacus]GAX90952.1 5'-3' exonuclease [Effusibacillus lacus]